MVTELLPTLHGADAHLDQMESCFKKKKVGKRAVVVRRIVGCRWWIEAAAELSEASFLS